MAKGDRDRICQRVRKRIAALPAGSVVLAADETHLDLLAKIRACWTPHRLRYLIPTPGSNKRRTLFGATEPVDTSSAVGRMLIQMLGVFAQFEREILIDRVINAMERKATKGEWCGRRVPHGYELNSETKKLQVAQDEDLHIKSMFEVFNQLRLGTKDVAKELGKRGFRTRSGNPWSGNTILAILRNRTYLVRSTSAAPGTAMTIITRRSSMMKPSPRHSRFSTPERVTQLKEHQRQLRAHRNQLDADPLQNQAMR